MELRTIHYAITASREDKFNGYEWNRRTLHVELVNSYFSRLKTLLYTHTCLTNRNSSKILYWKFVVTKGGLLSNESKIIKHTTTFFITSLLFLILLCATSYYKYLLSHHSKPSLSLSLSIIITYITNKLLTRLYLSKMKLNRSMNPISFERYPTNFIPRNI